LRRSGGGGEGGGGHDGAGSMRWLLTYADLITLLMVFFVVLYSISQINSAKYFALATALRQSFLNQQGQSNQGNAVINTATRPATLAKALPQNSTLSQLGVKISHQAKGSGLSREVTVALTTEGLDISFQTSGIFFRKASAQLQPQFQALLRRLAPTLKTVPNQIRVEGFTDNEVCNCPKYPTAWDLAAARAVRVTRFLQQSGVPPQRLAAISFGQWHPRFSNATAAGQARNRSVDLLVLKAGTGEPTTDKTLQQIFGSS
jgi:chemotaxis protein MotB